MPREREPGCSRLMPVIPGSHGRRGGAQGHGDAMVMGSTRSQWDRGLRAEREGVTERHVQECEKSVLDLES